MHLVELADRPFGTRLWLANLDQHLPEADAAQALSPEEQQRAARLVYARDRRRYLAAHLALRAVLGQALGVPGGEPFRTGAHGKPALGAGRAGFFSLSHSAAFAAIAVHPTHEIGVDIEAVDPAAGHDNIVAHCFTPEEQAAWRRAAQAGRAAEVLYSLWACKEACLKATGFGLAVAPADVAVGWPVSAPTRVVVPGPDGAAPAAVDVLPVHATHGLLAMAVARRAMPAG